MDCIGTNWLNGKEQLERLNRKAADLRIPLSGSIDLTHRCNLNCVHCYLGPHPGRDGRREQELGAAKIISLIDEFTAAGCINLLITGGEPLLRRDFSDIYRHAKACGLLVTIFTNGTLLTDEILALFEDLPPHLIEITVYGATKAVYETITGVAGSYDRCMSGIRRLLDRRLHVRMKTILMTLNRHEFFAIKAMARSYGVSFRFDAAIFPRLNGDRTPLELRVSAEEAVRMEFADGEKTQQWIDYFERQTALAAPDRLYQCGAGLCSFHIDPCGYLQPCLMASDLRFSLRDGAFADGWRDAMPHIRRIKAGSAYACNTCEKIGLCGFCPAFFRMEMGASDARSDFICAMGQLRFEAIRQKIAGRNT